MNTQQLHSSIKAMILSTLLLIGVSLDSIATTVYARNDGDWDITSNWSTAGVGGASCSCVPGSTDDVVIDGFLMDIDNATGNVTIASLTITNDDEEQSDLILEGSIKLTITGNLNAIAEDEEEHVDIYVSDSSELEVQGNTTFERDSDNEENERLRLHIYDNGVADFQGDFTFNWLDGDGENADEIFIEDFGQMLVGGNMIVYKDGGNNNGSDIFTLNMDDDAILDITGTFTITQDGNYDVLINVANDANIHVGGIMTVTLNSGDDILFNIDNDAVIDVDSDLVLDHNGGDDFIIDLDNSSILNVDGDLTMDIDATGSDLMRIDLASTSSLVVDGDFDMIAYASASCELETNDDSEFYLGGNWTRRASPNNYGLMDANNNSTVHFVGSIAQILPQTAGAGSDILDFQNVVINNTYATSPQFTMEGDMIINESLTMTDGVINTSSSSQIFVEDNATSTSGSVDSYINGPMTKIGDDDFVFPLGKAGKWRRLSIDNFGGNSNEFEAEYFTSAHADVSNMVADLDLVSSIEYWNLNRVVDDGGEPDVTLYWEDANVSSIQSLADLRVSRYNAGTPEWENEGQLSTTGGVGSSSGTIITTANVTAFGAFTFASEGFGNILPIELISFEAEKSGSEVLLNWETANELNNDRFEVLRSGNGIDFDVIGFVKGGGTLSGGAVYEFIDEEPLFGSNYYQLRQVDFDDKSEVSEIKHVNNDLTADASFGVKIFPNPINSGQSLNIEYDADADPNAHFLVVLYDITGREVYSQIAIHEEGKIKTALPINDELPNGIYMVVGSSTNKIEFKERIIIGSPAYGNSAALSGR